MKILFLVNPNAGGRANKSAIEIARKTFFDAGWVSTVETTTSPDQAGSLIKSAPDQGYDLLVVAGGDGTIHNTVQHLPICTPGNPSKLPFAIFPLGSGNDFFRGTGSPRDHKGAAENIVNGKAVPIDIGIVEPINDDGSPRSETPVRFTNTAGVGMDSQTLATREKSPPWMSARYEVLFLMTLMKLYPLKVSLDAGDWKLDKEAYWLLCCNSGYIGSGMHVAPDASVTDGLLNVLIIPKMSKLKFILNLPKVFKGTHLEMKGVEIRRAKSLTLRLDREQRIATDGDRAFNAPARIRALPGAVSLWTSYINGRKV